MPGKVETLADGRGIPVVIPEEDHTFVLDEDALSALLLREDVRDRAVVVLSVAGAFRKGKSFLLDFFLRYMHHKYILGESGEGWLGADDEPLKGFSWRGGSERDTTGLLLWSQPFKATLANGEKVVIFLMDTQGTFDSESTVRDNAIVFALSTMLSSVLIYNLSQNIEEDDLQHLQLFTDYGSLAQEKSVGKPFQRLQFLIRDWSVPYEYPYGAQGGLKLLHKRLEVHEGQHKELQTLRQHIQACFEELACFLMPHPGLNVATSPEFNGKLADIRDEFKTSLRQLVPMLLAPENLVPKLIGGQKVKAKDLMQYFRVYMNIFNGSELPTPKTILEATAEANNLSAVAEARDVYDFIMDEVCGGAKPYLDPRRLEDEHRRAKDKALHAFHSKKKMGGGELADSYRERLEKEIQEQYQQLQAHNEGKNIFRMAGTPAVLVALVILGYLLSVLGGAFGLQTLVAVGQMIIISSTVTLGVWAYSRISGNMRDISLQIDGVADTVRNYVMRQAVGGALLHSTDSSADKKSS
ncbi:atlastin-like [Galleria mellonella]|uniref:Atlastin-like n=1 Tax=Galleria mellonella TaxID=7137 RepID=A0ABM3MYX5_GALME|nr:atlastin-like [Galleria mellonella]